MNKPNGHYPEKKQEIKPCPQCGSSDVTFGYGLAAGGCGSYRMCLNCDWIGDSVQDQQGDESTK